MNNNNKQECRSYRHWKIPEFAVDSAVLKETNNAEEINALHLQRHRYSPTKGGPFGARSEGAEKKSDFCERGDAMYLSDIGS